MQILAAIVVLIVRRLLRLVRPVSSGIALIRVAVAEMHPLSARTAAPSKVWMFEPAISAGLPGLPGQLMPAVICADGGDQPVVLAPRRLWRVI